MAVRINRPTDLIQRKVRLCGKTEIMFDRYAGDNTTKLEPQQKLYLSPQDSKTIGIPAVNIMSSLSAHNTNSFPKRLRDIRKYKKICNACLSFVSISPGFIPLLRDSKPIEFSDFNEDEVDPKSGCYVDHRVARLPNGIPNPVSRPVIPLPWAIEFDFELFPNKEITEQEIVNLFTEGGGAIGLGTFRGVFGKFSVDMWK